MGGGGSQPLSQGCGNPKCKLPAQSTPSPVPGHLLVASQGIGHHPKFSTITAPDPNSHSTFCWSTCRVPGPVLDGGDREESGSPRPCPRGATIYVQKHRGEGSRNPFILRWDFHTDLDAHTIHPRSSPRPLPTPHPRHTRKGICLQCRHTHSTSVSDTEVSPSSECGRPCSVNMRPLSSRIHISHPQTSSADAAVGRQIPLLLRGWLSSWERGQRETGGE